MPDSRTEADEAFLAVLTDAADEHADRVLAGLDDLLAGAPHHRTVMAAAKSLAACATYGRSRFHASDEAAAAVVRLVRFLAALQGDDGLFDGENLSSPPDTAFTVNDLCDTYALLDGTVHTDLAEAARGLERIAEAALEPLLHGGVHTPNHRWELCAALARLHRHWPDRRLVDRVDAWLAEGVDIAGDGMYSERSAIYALYVSNPSLTAIGTALDRPELLDAVCRNLEAVMTTTLPDGSVETVHSRRQDQRGSMRAAGFLMQFRRFAISRNRADFAGVVEELLREPIADPAGALTEVLLEPDLAGPLPPARPREPVRTVFPSSGLAVVRKGAFYAAVFGGSDYAAHGRIRSGLASNPTFLRIAGGEAVLDSVRLSRDFFGIGPFRADGLIEDGNGVFMLREQVAAAYYGPLPAEYRRADGAYALSDEGRFSASMDFAHRPTTEVALATLVRIAIGEGAVVVECEADPARVRQTLELTFRPGGALTGVHESIGDGNVMVGDRCEYRCGDDAIEVAVDGAGPEPAGPGSAYHPGEDYTHLGGTDASEGVKLLIPIGRTGRANVRLRYRRRES